MIAVDENTEILFKDKVIKENEWLKEQLNEQKSLVKIAEIEL